VAPASQAVMAALNVTWLACAVGLATKAQKRIVGHGGGEKNVVVKRC